MYKWIVALIIVPYTACAQQKLLKSKDKIPGPEELERASVLAYKEYQCFNSNKYSATQRSLFFPFSQAATIQLVSFADTNKIYTPLGVNNFYIDKSKVIETRVLSKRAIDSLTNILYNIGRTPIKNLLIRVADPGAKCYEPRNAILFINNTGIVTQYIELCFGCNKYYFSSSKIRPMETCEQKFDLLKAFFLGQGIKYGTILPKRHEE